MSGDCRNPKVEQLGFEKNKVLRREFNNQRVQAVIGGKACNFRSKLEHKWAQYCQFRKEQGLIKDWWFEETTFRFENEKCGAVKYLVDFDIRNNDDTFHYEECKGYLSSKDTSKFRKVRKHYPDTKIILVMQSIGKKYNHSLRIAEKHVERIIDASKIFRQIGIK